MTNRERAEEICMRAVDLADRSLTIQERQQALDDVREAITAALDQVHDEAICDAHAVCIQHMTDHADADFGGMATAVAMVANDVLALRASKKGKGE